MPPPIRSASAGYHFHVYDYHDSKPFEPSRAQPQRGGLQFFSLVQDLNGLLQSGQGRVPNIALTRYPVPEDTEYPVAEDADTGQRDIMVLSFGDRGIVAKAPAVVITGGIHAREWIAPEMAYLLAEYLIINYPPGSRGLTRYQRAIRELVDSRRIHIIPMLNPNGNSYTVFSADPEARLWRKNRRVLPSSAGEWFKALMSGNPPESNPPFLNVREGNEPVPWASYEVPDYDPGKRIPPDVSRTYRTTVLPTDQIGVDQNRNFATTAWGYECHANDSEGHADDPEGKLLNADPKSEAYFGPAAGSERETQSVTDFLALAGRRALGLRSSKIATSVDYHSYAGVILYPGEADYAGAVDPGYERLGQVLTDLSEYTLGTPLEKIGYNATGSVADYIAQQYHARAFTIELDPRKSDQIGFQLPEDRIMRVFEKNILPALAAIEGAGSPLGGTSGGLNGRLGERAAQRVVAKFRGWGVNGRGNQLPV